MTSVVPYVHAQWCDDIRQEIGNKPSLMGVYTGGLVVGALPAQLPKLCLFLSIVVPLDRPMASVMVRIVRSDERVLAEVGPIVPPQDEALGDFAMSGATRKVMHVAAVMSPLELPEGTEFLEAQCEVDGERFDPSRLWIRRASNGDSPDAGV